MKNTQKKSFPRIMLEYAVYFLCIAAIGLTILFRFLGEYERAQPETVIDTFTESFNASQVASSVKAFLATLDTNIQSENEVQAIIYSYFEDGIQCVRDATSYSNEELKYVIKCGDTIVGSIILTRGDETISGLRPWYISEQNYDFSFLEGLSASWTVPDDYTVICNGYVLGEEYITEDSVEYDWLKDYYGKGYSLPYMRTYSVDGVCTELDVHFLDSNGISVEIPEENAQDFFLSSNCTEEEKKALDEFIAVFIEKYVAFTGSSRDNYMTNYTALEPYMIPGSDIQTRTYNARESLSYGGHRENIIESIETDKYINIGNGEYMCGITYIVNVRGSGHYTLIRNEIRIIISYTDNGFFASSIPEKTTSTVE